MQVSLQALLRVPSGAFPKRWREKQFRGTVREWLGKVAGVMVSDVRIINRL